MSSPTRRLPPLSRADSDLGARVQRPRVNTSRRHFVPWLLMLPQKALLSLVYSSFTAWSAALPRGASARHHFSTRLQYSVLAFDACTLPHNRNKIVECWQAQCAVCFIGHLKANWHDKGLLERNAALPARPGTGKPQTVHWLYRGVLHPLLTTVPDLFTSGCWASRDEYRHAARPVSSHLPGVGHGDHLRWALSCPSASAHLSGCSSFSQLNMAAVHVLRFQLVDASFCSTGLGFRVLRCSTDASP